MISSALSFGFYSLLAFKDYLWKGILGSTGILAGIIYSGVTRNKNMLTK